VVRGFKTARSRFIWVSSATSEPAQKAHPALLVRDLRALARTLAAAGVHVVEDDAMPGYDRVYVSDRSGIDWS
jgi:hypothetical protein